jgi:membrane associated rhomboid family serine protease
MEWGIISSILDDFSFHWNVFRIHPIFELPNLASYVFLHGSEEHLIGNLIFFSLFTPAVEEVMGSLTFFISFFVWGAAGAIVQGYFSPFDNGLIGASGAISGAAGAFFVLYPLSLPPRYIQLWFGKIIGRIPAFFFIGLWFLAQLKLGLASLVVPEISSQVTLVAYWAHIGGFAAGALSVVPWIGGLKWGKSKVT